MTTRITVVQDSNGERLGRLKLHASAPIGTLIPRIVTALARPLSDGGGRSVTYNLVHNGRVLSPTDTLDSANVGDNATLTLVPEMTAGNGG